MSGRPAAVGTDELPGEMRFGLVESLFADSRSMVLGSIMTSLSGIIITILMHSWASGVASAAMIVVTAMRIHLVKERSKQSQINDGATVRQRERNYVIGVSMYLFCIGVIAFCAFTDSSDAFVLVLALSIAITNVLSIAVRNFAIQYGIAWQIAATAVPLGIAFLVRGGLFPLLIPMLLAPLWMFVQTSAARLRTMLLSEMAYRRHSETIAGQFDFAINNMSHGMCMISAEKKILVSNAKFAEIFGLPGNRSIANVRFKSLLRLAARRGAIPKNDRDRLLNSLTVANVEVPQRNLQIETASGNVYDVTLKHHSNGGCVIVVQDVTEKRNAERAIDHMARFDAVTNLRNRRTFEIALTEALACARVTGARSEVLFIDLDEFKQVNDTLGHKIGDKVLVTAGNRLRAIAGEYDFIARWGGDEFVILRSKVPGGADIETFATKIISELSRPCSIEGCQVVVGASIGVAVAIGGDLAADVILQQADMALYAAKREGRGHCRVYEEAMTISAQARRLLELELHAALATRAFELQYQPIVNLETHAVVSLEALARWSHPTRGEISPTIFVPVLEELNLIDEFGVWALQRACHDAMRWPSNIRVGVNVSAKQLEGDTLYDAIERALKTTGLAPNRLELEITETALLGGNEAAEKKLERVHALGVTIALDDFGTGYSSLSHLMRFPLDKVKIDQSFTKMLGKEEKAAILIENVARLSRQLGMVVTVEGIETYEQLERLKRLGSICEGQGYLFSKPISSDAVEKLFDRAGQLHIA
jgi:diguanylate cyclase (GGDEF)-like protein